MEKGSGRRFNALGRSSESRSRIPNTWSSGSSTGRREHSALTVSARPCPSVLTQVVLHAGIYIGINIDRGLADASTRAWDICTMDVDVSTLGRNELPDPALTGPIECLEVPF